MKHAGAGARVGALLLASQRGTALPARPNKEEAQINSSTGRYRSTSRHSAAFKEKKLSTERKEDDLSISSTWKIWFV
jgi:hypothetical protein